jgi:ferredoxin
VVFGSPPSQKPSLQVAAAMPKITFIKEKKTVEVPAGTVLRTAALNNGIEVYKGLSKLPLIGHCPGIGGCATCFVHIKKGMENCSGLSFMEQLWYKVVPCPAGMMYIGHEHERRLSCQVRVNGNIEVETTPEDNYHGENFWS